MHSSLEWKSYYLAIGVTSKFVGEAMQYLLDKGKIHFSDFFLLTEEKKRIDALMIHQLVPSHLADRRYHTGRVDLQYLFAIDLWGYYAEKYLFTYEAILRYGQDEQSLHFVYQNLLLDFKEGVDTELICLKKYTQNIFK